MGKVKSVKLIYPKDNKEVQKRYAKALVKILCYIASNEEIEELIYKI